MEWTNKKVFELINLYRERPILWNCRMEEYRDRSKKINALLEISDIIGVEKEEVERKIKNLVCHFLRETKKERDSIKYGEGDSDVYKSKWYCYSRMMFLKDRTQPKGMADTHTQDRKTSEDNVEVTQEETQNVDQEPLEDSDGNSESGKKRSKRKLFKSPRSDSQKKHKSSATEETLSIMRDMQVHNALHDQYTAFGDHVGMVIRDLPTSNAKHIVKYIISNILFEAEMGKYNNINSINTAHSQHFRNILQFSRNLGEPSHPQEPSNSDRKPTTIQHSPLSPTLSFSYAPIDSDSMDSIKKEI